MAGESSGETISIVVPAYNEEQVLPEFHSRLAAVLDGLNLASEIIYVNDGSQDGTLGVLHALRADDARGDATVVIDADLQDPPELIPALVKHWTEGAPGG